MNAEPSWKNHRRIWQLAASLLIAASCAVARAEIVLSVTPEENAAKETKPGINVPKPKDDAGAKPAGPAPSDSLHFLNNDTLHGTLVGIDPAAGVRWKNSEAKEPIEFKTSNVSQIKLLGHAPTQPAKQHQFSVRLVNGDEFLGDIATLDADKLELDTWYAGRLSIPRKALRGITPLHSSAFTIYEGPTSLEGWKSTENRGSWRYKDGALIATSSGPIGRDLKLPDMSSIDFDVSWRPYLQLMVSLYTDTVENYGGNCYMLQLNSNYCYLQKMRPNGGSSNLGQAQIESLQRKSKAHISIRVNKEQKMVALIVDGALVKQWNDRGDFAGKGGGLVFYSQGQGLMKISGIRVQPWDGKFEEHGAGAEKSKEDTVRMENNDKVSGKLEGIKEGNMQFSSSFAKLEIPLKRVEQIEFASDGSAPPKPAATDVRAFFAGRGQVTCALEKWDDKGVGAKSPSFGAATFSPQAFERLQFNLDQQSAKEEDIDSADAEGQDGDPPIKGGARINQRAVILE